MKIAVTAQGQNPDSLVEQRFGRTNWFVLYDSDTRTYSYIENSMVANAAQGAGIQSAQNIANNSVNIVITGNCGPKAFRALDTAGIKLILNVSGTVQECIDKWEKGFFSYATSPNSTSHGV
ncbi:MAG: NifB/NifX family molybdenum-iron cluster-binding protein [Candidatus Auribacterota bacterium]|jgi:predicted Fe-Mo cluster-binding NifX family protein|nr:NifB/NifX family molybdenum-iron cluster-binding protein [Candidatus Auribacterota bacterium]